MLPKNVDFRERKLAFWKEERGNKKADFIWLWFFLDGHHRIALRFATPFFFSSGYGLSHKSSLSDSPFSPYLLLDRALEAIRQELLDNKSVSITNLSIGSIDDGWWYKTTKKCVKVAEIGILDPGSLKKIKRFYLYHAY